MSKERPILFSGPMVRALLDGSKTQTRRVLKVPHENPLGKWEVLPWGGPNGGRTRDGQTVPFQNVIGHTRTGEIIACPYGQPGERLWVRETWRGIVKTSAPWDDCTTYSVAQYVPDQAECRRIEYAATFGKGAKGWRPSIHMPRWASRITLEITSVRVERLQDISSRDAIAEGIEACPLGGEWRNYIDSAPNRDALTPRVSFRSLWESINGPGSWDANPWVWAIEFRRLP